VAAVELLELSKNEGSASELLLLYPADLARGL
jgi:hypothetical protein